MRIEVDQAIEREAAAVYELESETWKQDEEHLLKVQSLQKDLDQTMHREKSLVARVADLEDAAYLAVAREAEVERLKVGGHGAIGHVICLLTTSMYRQKSSVWGQIWIT